MPTYDISGVQYSGKWNLQAQAQAKSASTWPVAPEDGKRFVWGSNVGGRLGTDNTTNYSSPIQVGADVWTHLEAMDSSGGGVKAAGSLWMWGTNGSGRLGTGNTTNYSSPVQIGALTNWLRVTNGYSTYAVKTDGTFWVWGYNGVGQLGTSDNTSYSSPVQVGALTNWLRMSSNYAHALALKTDGTLWAMGKNNNGQLGDGTTTNRNSPVQIGALTDWLSIACGIYTSFGVRSNGTMYSWGISAGGNFGPNLGQSRTGAPNSSSPTQIGALTTWLAVAAGTYNILAVKTDGTLWAWGTTGFGTANGQNSPVQVGTATTWTNKITAGAGGGTSVSMNAGIQSDGTLWAWGFNDTGQLGQGNTTPYTSPMQVGSLNTWGSVSAWKGGVQALGKA